MKPNDLPANVQPDRARVQQHLAAMRGIVGGTGDPFGFAWDRLGEPQRRFLLALTRPAMLLHIASRPWAELTDRQRGAIKSSVRQWRAWFLAVIPDESESQPH